MYLPDVPTTRIIESSNVHWVTHCGIKILRHVVNMAQQNSKFINNGHTYLSTYGTTLKCVQKKALYH